MKRQGKKLLSLLLCLLVFLSLPGAAFAAPTRGPTLLSGDWEVGRMLVEQVDDFKLYFELEDPYRDKMARWMIHMHFESGAVVVLDSEGCVMELYAEWASGYLGLCDSTHFSVHTDGNRQYGWAELPSEWEYDAVLSELTYGEMVCTDVNGNMSRYLEYIPRPDHTPAYNTVYDGTYYGTLYGATRSGSGWIVEISVEMYDLYSESYVQSLHKGDRVWVCDHTERVESRSDGRVFLDDSSSLGRYRINWTMPDQPSGWWVAMGPNGLEQLYGLGTAYYSTSSRTVYVDNTELDEIHLSSPLEVLSAGYDSYTGGAAVIFTVEDGVLTYLESMYLP